MRPAAALAAVVLAVALGGAPASYAGDPLPTWPGAVRSPVVSPRPLGAPRPGGAANQGLQDLRRYEQRNRLEDLRRDTRRHLEQGRLRDDPLTLERTRRRWRAEDRETDFRRQRELDAIEHGVGVRERIDRAAERLPGPGPAGSDEEARRAFDRKLDEVEQREQVERLGRDAQRRIWSGPGVRRGAP
jgi:hypothetical protein